MAQQENLSLNVNRKDIIDAPTISCQCGSKLFKPAIILKKVPGFMLGLGKEEVAFPIDVMVCEKCGELAPSIKEDKTYANLLNGKEVTKTESGLII